VSEPTYTITDDGTGIMCHFCGRTSSHPSDVAALYCANCKIFHIDQTLFQDVLASWRRRCERAEADTASLLRALRPLERAVNEALSGIRKPDVPEWNRLLSTAQAALEAGGGDALLAELEAARSVVEAARAAADYYRGRASVLIEDPELDLLMDVLANAVYHKRPGT
jgi:hypothetical protein